MAMYQVPHRKPIPTHPAVGSRDGYNNNNGNQPLTNIVPDSQLPPLTTTAQQRQQQQQQQYFQSRVPSSSSSSSHNRNRTASSGTFPPEAHQDNPQPPEPLPTTSQTYYNTNQTPARTNPTQPIPPNNMTHRVPSTATTLTSNTSSQKSMSSANQPGPGRTYSTLSISLRRSTSSRSGGSSISPSSYVALMRKQKATVWCDRSQHEDPRLLAAQKAAKMRATMEVVGSGGRTSMSGSMGSGAGGGVRSKIRHHGAQKALGYHPGMGNLVGGGVPMRLSASEVGDEGPSDEDTDSAKNLYHTRTGSGRSSLASGQRLAAYGGRAPTMSSVGGRLSTGHTPPSGPASSPGDGVGSPNLSDPAETPVPKDAQKRGGSDYFTANTATSGVGGGGGGGGGSGSGGSSEREASFGNVGDIKAPSVAMSGAGGLGVKKEGKTAQDLARRGSVDERAPTMLGARRLFVANPDLSD